MRRSRRHPSITPGALAVFALLGLATVRAGADGGEADRAHVIIADVASDAVLVTAVGRENWQLGAFGVAACALGAPGVHGYHGHWEAAGQAWPCGS